MDKRKALSACPPPRKASHSKGLRISKGFTLAEVLITLAIIGVVAVLTVPTLMQKYQEQMAIVGVSKAFAIFSDVLKKAEIDNGSIETWDIGAGSSEHNEQNAIKIGNILMPYFKTQKICGIEAGCFPDKYQTFENKNFYPTNYNTHRGSFKAILNDGMIIAIVHGGEHCVTNHGIYKTCASIQADINGFKGPNKAGIDLFAFQFTQNGVRPAGEKGFTNASTDCQYGSLNAGNGLVCTAWVYYKKNLDYTKHKINWD